VPPLEGVDFTSWQQELGAYALPYGLNTFPIQQLGREADYVLSLDNRNCQRYAYQTVSPQSKLESQLNYQFRQYPTIMNIITSQQATTVEFCSYL
jgi:hypothetical protein